MLPFFPGLIRGFLIAAFTAFHIVIHLTMNVGWFSMVMVAGLCALIPSAAWDHFEKKKNLEVKYHKKFNVVFLFLALILLQTVLQSDLAPFSRSHLPRPVQKAMLSLGLSQKWNLFAPGPAPKSYTFYVYPTYKKVWGSAYPARMIPLESTKLRRCIKYLENFRQKKYGELLYSKYLKAYLIREWNEKNPRKPLSDVEIIAKEERYRIKTVDYIVTGWVLL